MNQTKKSKIKPVLVISFLAILVAMVVFMMWMWKRGLQEKVDTLAVRGAVVSIRLPDKRKPNWRVARLTDSSSIVLEDVMLGTLQVGDSITKQKGNNWYLMKSARTGESQKIIIRQP